MRDGRHASPVVDGIGRIVPEIEALLGGFQPTEHLPKIAEFLFRKHSVDLAGLRALYLFEGLEDAVPNRSESTRAGL